MKGKSLLGIASLAVISIARLVARKSGDENKIDENQTDQDQDEYKSRLKEQFNPPTTTKTRQQRRREAIQERRRLQRQARQQPRRVQRFSKVLISFLVAALGVISAAATLYVFFLPRLSVSSLVPLNPSDPFSTPFTISNNGYFALNNVVFSCRLRNVEAADTSGGMYDSNTTWGDHPVPVINAGESATATCYQPIKWLSPITKADAEVIVTFRQDWMPRSQEKRFRFTTEKGADGQLHWWPQPLSRK